MFSYRVHILDETIVTSRFSSLKAAKQFTVSIPQDKNWFIAQWEGEKVIAAVSASDYEFAITQEEKNRKPGRILLTDDDKVNRPLLWQSQILLRRFKKQGIK